MADSSKKMQIVFASAECAPFVKTGGLGDVAGSLPAALVRAGAEVIVMVPKYATIKDEYKAQMEHFSGWAGVIALALLQVPIVIRTTENMLKLVRTREAQARRRHLYVHRQRALLCARLSVWLL